MQGCRRLQNKVAIVTASTEGIGYAIAERLLSEGASVVISSRKQNNVDKALRHLRITAGQRVVGRVCHVGETKHRQELIEYTVKTFGKIDILISNAAVNPETVGILEMSETAIDKVIDVNIKSAIMLVREAVPYMNEEKSSIVFISSIAAYYPMYQLGMYSVSKTALLGLTKVLSQELVTRNIRVNCVASGPVHTRFAQVLRSTAEWERRMKDIIPMQRFGYASEIAAVVAFLVSDDASYVTGETIAVAGGHQSRL